MRNSTQHLLRSKGEGGGSKKALCPLSIRGRGPCKKQACFLEGAAWNFRALPPLVRVLKRLHSNWGQTWGAPLLQIQPSTDPIPELKPFVILRASKSLPGIGGDLFAQ